MPDQDGCEPRADCDAGADWDATRVAVAELLRTRARTRRTVTYAELVAEVGPIAFAPDDPALGRLLGEVSTDSDAAGSGMLTALVVRRSGRPGAGFYRLAERLGRDVSDRAAMWRAELERVFDAHAPGR